MVARPGRLQSGFTSGELSPLLHERTELKYFGTGAKQAVNVQILPQGGFSVRDGLRHVGALNAGAEKLGSFVASNGAAYDLVFSPSLCQVWGEAGLLDDFATGLTAPMLSTFTTAQQLDTMLLFHEDLETERVKHAGPTSWSLDKAPYVGIPRHDYGLNYTNGVDARWRLEMLGLTAGTAFVLTVSGQETGSISYDADTAVLAAAMEAEILALPNVSPGAFVAVISPTVFRVVFDGAGNEGDGWAVSGRVINKADAAILSSKTTVGIVPGEPLISATRGWPQCGAFYGQRLLIGGFKSLPNAWMFSRVSYYYTYDERFTEANGPALVPMDVAGGERVERIVPNRNLLIFTSQAEYWIAERAISRTSAPNHVQSSRNGVRRGVPVIESEGAALYAHSGGDVLGEFRYTDVEGNFASTDISLLAPHLMRQARDISIRRAVNSVSGNLIGVVTDAGDARLVSVLREQEVTAFTRMVSDDATFRACSVNGRNQMGFIVDRDARRFERLEPDLLLDSAETFIFDPVPSDSVTGLSRFEGLTVWAIGDGHVFGPFVVTGGEIALPVAVSEVTVGHWTPPLVETLPPPRTIGPNTVLKRRARIHSLQLSLIDTTSIAVAVNGGKLRDVDLTRYGMAADVPELSQPFTGQITLRGLTGFHDEPTVTISQVRPGRMTVRSIVVEAAL